MSIPTEADWRSEVWGIDTPSAYEHFFSKSMEEAIRLFETNAIYYQEDIMFMPLACFRFYAGAYTEYLLSETSRGDSDGASCFFGLVEIRQDDIRSSALLISEFTRVLRHLRDNQSWYKADKEIYGSFSDKSERCLELIGPHEQKV